MSSSLEEGGATANGGDDGSSGRATLSGFSSFPSCFLNKWQSTKGLCKQEIIKMHQTPCEEIYVSNSKELVFRVGPITFIETVASFDEKEHI